MCLPHAKKCRWNTGFGVAGLLVVVALVLIRTNFDVCWSSLSLSHLFFPLISSLRSLFVFFVFLLLCFILFFILTFLSFSLSLSFHLFLSWPDSLRGRNKRKSHLHGPWPVPCFAELLVRVRACCIETSCMESIVTCVLPPGRNHQTSHSCARQSLCSPNGCPSSA